MALIWSWLTGADPLALPTSDPFCVRRGDIKQFVADQPVVHHHVALPQQLGATQGEQAWVAWASSDQVDGHFGSSSLATAVQTLGVHRFGTSNAWAPEAASAAASATLAVPVARSTAADGWGTCTVANAGADRKRTGTVRRASAG